MPTAHISKNLEKIINENVQVEVTLGAKLEAYINEHGAREETLAKENEFLRKEIVSRLPSIISVETTPTLTTVYYARIERIIKTALESAMAR